MIKLTNPFRNFGEFACKLSILDIYKYYKLLPLIFRPVANEFLPSDDIRILFIYGLF